eukprot:6182853-Alexandrium_andersonii.AAC.1
MSASLVGSEMCIRDRALALLAPGKLGIAASTLAAVALGLPAQGGHRWPCLLYTSDAADDM